MKELGTYKIQYNQVVEVYSDMLYQYNILSKKFEEEGFEATIDTEKSGGKKSPILASLENLRKDIGTYSDRLMLNAKTYNAEIEQPKKESVLEKLHRYQQEGRQQPKRSVKKKSMDRER